MTWALFDWGNTHLHEDSHCRATGITAALEYRSLEAIPPASKVARLWHNLKFIFVIGDDLRKLILDILRINWLSTDGSKSLSSVLELSFLDKISWGFRKDEQTDAQYHCPQELNGYGNSVRSAIIAVLGSIDNTVRDQDPFFVSAMHRQIGKYIPNRNTKLVAGHKRTADLFRGDFRHV